MAQSEPQHWVFAYGSLMWDPGFPVAECVQARVEGYSRRFCMQSVHYRGTAENPGLVLALEHDREAHCVGLALRVAELGVDCLRINPGNIGREDRIRAVVDAARHHGIPIRIGVNAGSLEKDLQKKYEELTADALVESALRHVEILDRLNFPDFKLSLKASDVFMTVQAYRKIANQIEQPLHLGITEAGSFRSGTVKSSIGLGLLMWDGIGDTIRVSLAADPIEEIKVGWDMLKALKLRSRGINLIACPSCSRQNFDVIGTVNALEERVEDIRTDMSVSIIGCVVNGPGEAKETDVGLTGGQPNLVYIDGKPAGKLNNETLVDDLERLIRARSAELEEQRKNLIISEG